MQHPYAYDLALLKMTGLIRDAELERAAAEGRSARLSRPGPRAWVRAAIARLDTASSGAKVVSSDCFETATATRGRAL